MLHLCFYHPRRPPFHSPHPPWLELATICNDALCPARAINVQTGVRDTFLVNRCIISILINLLLSLLIWIVSWPLSLLLVSMWCYGKFNVFCFVFPLFSFGADYAAATLAPEVVRFGLKFMFNVQRMILLILRSQTYFAIVFAPTSGPLSFKSRRVLRTRSSWGFSWMPQVNETLWLFFDLISCFVFSVHNIF